jgi:hypothetical protein
MPITINGLTGISGADGSAATPFIRGSDADTGLYFPSAGNAAISINGTQTLLVDNSNNVTMTGNLTAGNVTATEFRFANGASVLSAASSTLTGQIIVTSSNTAPTGYLKCDGNTYTKSSYTALSTALGSIPVSYASTYNISQVVNNAYGPYEANGKVFYTSDSGFYLHTTDHVTFSNVNISTSIGAYSPGRYGMTWTGTNYVSNARIRANDGAGSTYMTNENGAVYSSSLTTTSWSLASGSLTFIPRGFASNGSGTVVLVGEEYTTDFAYSTNHGASYTAFTIAAGSFNTMGRVSGVVWAPAAGLFIVIGWAASYVPAIYTSPNGITWTSRTVPVEFTSYLMKYISVANGIIFVFDTKGNLCTSTDGITWTFRQNLGDSVSTYVGGAGKVVYVASTGYYYANGYYSPNGFNWSVAPLKPGYAPYTWRSQCISPDGTKIFMGYRDIGTSTILNGPAATYTPFPYTVATQFNVPDYGPAATGTAPVYGAYYHVKT